MKYKIMEPNDWKCACGEINFRKRSVCRKCMKVKPNTLDNLKSQPLANHFGDWTCVCGELNFASRRSCRKCDKSGNAEIKMNIRPGDWKCVKCDEHNFKIRDICRKCNSPKNTVVNNVIDNIDDAEIEHLCVICLVKPKTHAITTCGHLCYCEVCGFCVVKCPICRESYKPEVNLIRIFS